MVFPAIWSDADTVYDVMNNPRLRGFVERTLENEIVPTRRRRPNRNQKVRPKRNREVWKPLYKPQTAFYILKQRFQMEGKGAALFMDYCEKSYGRIPANMAAGLSNLIHTLPLTVRKGRRVLLQCKQQAPEMKDDKEFSSFLDKRRTLAEFLSANIWGVNQRDRRPCGYAPAAI